jgi:sulfate/thiosulfate transport system substrate-binding protein
MKSSSTLTAVGVTLAAATIALGCGSGSGESNSGGGVSKKGTVALVSYSTPREVYEKQIPAFRKTDAGKDVEFTESYASSGEQSRAVEGGLPADVVAFSLEPDITRLTEAGLVDQDWNDNETKGMVTESVVVFAVRKGNPKNITAWDDLLEDDVEIVTPNPFTSGGARWNLMAAYGAWLEQGKTEDEALANLKTLLENTPVQSKSAREALQVFAQGKGDVMLAYENEAITAQDKGEEIDYVIPDETILIENPIAVTAKSKNADAAQAFVDYLLSEDGQRLFGEGGYRPVDDAVAEEFADDFPEPKTLFTIEKFGGWDAVMDEFFDREKGSVAKIEQELGVPTDG